MKKQFNIIGLLLVLAALPSCKKNGYVTDTGTIDPHVNMTTYDFLKSKAVFSKLVYLIDKAGLKNQVNSDITFFATTDYGIDDYVKIRQRWMAKLTGNENYPYTIDSIPVPEIQDSLRMYMFPGKINREQMNRDGKIYTSVKGSLSNVQMLIRLVKTTEYNSYVSSVDFVNLTKVIDTRDDFEANPDLIPQAFKDVSVNCQTSGIITTTGILHVLDGRHILLFNSYPQ